MKFVRFIGIIASLTAFVLYIVLAFFNPYGQGVITLPVLLMILLSAAAGVSAWKAKPYILLVIALTLFLPIGFYMLGSPGIFKWIGVSNIILILTALFLSLKSLTKSK